MFEDNLYQKAAEQRANNNRRVLFIIIVLAVLLCLMPGLAFAEENHVTAEHTEPRDSASPTLHISREDIIITANEQGIIILDPHGLGVPVVPPVGHKTWSFANLALAFLSVLVLAIMGIRVSLSHHKSDSYPSKRRFELEKSSYPTVTLVALITAVMSVVLFFLTQDVRHPMVLFDWWTTAFALLLVIVIAASILPMRDKRNSGKETSNN